MRRSTIILVAKCATILSVIPALILASSAGAPARRTGAPGDLGTCNAAGCHVGSAPTGRVRITAAGGTSYTPGQRQRITVTIEPEPAASIHGFEASARLTSNLVGGQAGALHALGPDTQVICEDDRAAPCRDAAPVQFITHTSPKPTNVFEFDWTPPADASAGDVRLFAAGNAANGNGQPTGDRIFTADLTLSPAAASGPRPTIRSNDGVQNGATFQPGIASGSWATIRGENLAENTRIWLENDFVNGAAPTELDGVRVNIDGKPAAVFFISPTQINVQTPALDRTGDVPVEVITRNGTSNTATANVLQAAPGWLMFDAENRRYIAGTHVDGTFLGKPGLFGVALTTRPAQPGNVIVLYGANFGPTNPPMPSGRAVAALAPLVATPRIQIGGADATVQYGGGAPNLIGTYQFNLVVPQLPNGDHEVVVTLPDGSRTQTGAFITVQNP